MMTADGFFRTGDIGVMDEKGYTKIVDRKKDMILVSGFNVYPNEIEEVIASHPGVLECAVIGVPDAKSGEAVKAFIVKKDPNLTGRGRHQVLRHAAHRLQGPQADRVQDRPARRPMSARSCAANCATRRRPRPSGGTCGLGRWLKHRVTPADILAFWRDAGPDALVQARRRLRRGGAPALSRASGRARQPANCRHGRRAMTARWRSSSCSTSFPQHVPRRRQDLCQRRVGARGGAAAPSTAAWTRGSIPPCVNSSICRSCIRSIWPTSCAASSCRATAGHAENLKWAEHHADIIRRFGRFPHRNRLLGRATTPEEQAFLDEGGFFAVMTEA